ncbi:helix-turn-helix domain-containing protein [Ottowia sp. VDI28]|uniref:helix-turn-helix domain-containing protein n=1 Tax=Ottowia sp. VDI28 TaxID=3133968 RepID=UPI003C2BCD54
MSDSLLHLFVSNLKAFGIKKGLGSAPALAKATKGGVGKSTVGRYFANDGNPSLDHIEALATAVGVAPWELLRPPGMDDRRLSVEQALSLVIATIAQLPQPARKALSEDLGLLAVAPGDAETRARVLQAMGVQDASGGGNLLGKEAA